MLRSLLGKAFGAASCVTNVVAVTAARSSLMGPLQKKSICFFATQNKILLPNPAPISTALFPHSPTTNGIQLQTSRNLTKFSLNKGKRKSVRAVIKRFRRLDWGIWIRTHSGRQKKLFKKSSALKRRLRQHIFTNSTQSWMLDKMVGNFWRRPKHWIDDPYAPYNKRDEFFATKSKSFKV